MEEHPGPRLEVVERASRHGWLICSAAGVVVAAVLVFRATRFYTEGQSEGMTFEEQRPALLLYSGVVLVVLLMSAAALLCWRSTRLKPTRAK